MVEEKETNKLNFPRNTNRKERKKERCKKER
jgi:hypothetical protein